MPKICRRKRKLIIILNFAVISLLGLTLPNLYFIQKTTTNEFNRPNSAIGISDVDFISINPDEDYYDWDYINGEYFRFWVRIQDASAGDIDSSDVVKFWIAPASDTDDTQVMENIQAGSYSHSSVSTWLDPGSYGGDTQIYYNGNGFWLFEVDSTIMDDYLGISLAFDCFAQDVDTGDIEELSWEDRFYWVRIIEYSVILTEPDPDEYIPSTTVFVEWSHPRFYNQYFDDLDEFEIWLDSGTHYTTTDTDYSFSSVSQGPHTAHVKAKSVNHGYGIEQTVNFIVDSIPPPAPSLVSPSNGAYTNDNTPYMDWSTAPDAVDYRIYVDDNSGFTSPLTYETSNTYYTLPTLSDDTYYWKVAAQDAATNWGPDSSTWSFTVDIIPLGPPSLSTPSDGANINDNSPYLNWSTVIDAVNYRIYIDDNSGFTSPLTYETSNIYYTLPTLSDDTYYWKVAAQDAATNWGSNSSIRSFTIDATPPSSPVLVSPSNGAYINDNTPDLNWDTVSDAVNYRIYVDNNSGFTSPSIYETSNTYYTLPVMSDDTYYWKVVAQDTATNWGLNCSTWSFTVDTIHPDPPSLSTPSDGANINDNTPDLNWETVSDAANYRIYVDDNSGFTSPLIYETSNTYYSLPVMSDDTYYWKVVAQDAATNWGLNSSTWSFTIDATPPSSPVLLTPSNGAYIKDTTPFLDWSIVPDAVNYRIYVDDNSGFSSPLTYETSNTYYTLPSISENTYYWKVAAQDAVTNWGPNSSFWAFTLDLPPPDAPVLSSITPNPSTTGNIYLDWNDVPNADNYTIYRYTSLITEINGSVTNLNTVIPSEYNDIGLDEGIYYYVIVSHNETGYSDLSNCEFITVNVIGPDPPELISPYNNTITNDINPFFVWNDVTDGVKYNIQIDNSTLFSNPLINITTLNLDYIPSSLLDGIYYWRVRAQDEIFWGNFSSYWIITVDTVQPYSPLLISPYNNTITGNSTLNFEWNSVSDVNLYQIQVDNSLTFSSLEVNSTIFETNFSAYSFSDGIYYWRVRARDYANNWGNYGEIRCFTIETTTPTININTPNGTYHNSAPIFDVDFFDAAGLDSAYYKIDNYLPKGLDTTGWIEIFYNISTSNYSQDILIESTIWNGLSEGSHMIYFKTWDDTKYTSDGALFSCLFYKDTTAPVITTSTSSIQKSGTTINFNVTDENGIIQILYKWDAEEDYTTFNLDNYPTTPLGDNQHYLIVSAQDYAGNWKNETLIFITDDTKPTAEISGISEYMEISDIITIFVLPQDENGIEYVALYRNQELLSTKTSGFLFTLDTTNIPNGDYLIYIKISDLAGNTNQYTYPITVANSQPADPVDLLNTIIGIIGGILAGIAAIIGIIYKIKKK